MLVLGIIGEFLTVAGSFAISFNAGLNALLEISNNGYKIDEVKVDEASSLVLTDVTLKKRKFGKIWGYILLLTPGVNLINAVLKGKKIKHEFMNEAVAQQLVVPMTDSEKELYKEANTKFEKLEFIFDLLTKDSQKQNPVEGFESSRDVKDLKPNLESSLKVKPIIRDDIMLQVNDEQSQERHVGHTLRRTLSRRNQIKKD